MPFNISARTAPLAAVLLGAVAFGLPVDAPAEDGTFCLVVLHNNDGESQIVDNGNPDEGGAARFISVVDRERRDARRTGCTGDGFSGNVGTRAVVLVQSGDSFIPSPEITASLETGADPIFDTIVISRADYDALAVGNHEFDFGPEFFSNFIGDIVGGAPYISANLDFSNEPALAPLADAGRRLAPSVVIKRQGVRIGLIGATTEALATISQSGNVIANPVQDAVQAEIDRLTAQGVEIIVLVAHLQNINNEIELVPMLSGLDAAIAGGGDELLLSDPADALPSDNFDDRFGDYPQVAQGADGTMVPIVTTTGEFQYLGRLEIEIENGVPIASGGRLVRVVDAAAFPDGVDRDPMIVEQVEQPISDFVAGLDETIIGNTQVMLNGERDPGIRTMEENLGNLFADALFTAATDAFPDSPPDAALQNGGGIRDSIDAGPVSVLDTFNVAPFSNFVVLVPDIPRDQFRQLIERGVSADLNPDGSLQAEGRFSQISGFSFTFDTAGTQQVLNDDGTIATPGGRIQSLVLDDGTVIVDGGVVVDGDPINLATIDFLANGGDGYPFDGIPFLSAPVTYQQAIRNFIEVTLGGNVTAADFPLGGEGRIQQQ